MLKTNILWLIRQSAYFIKSLISQDFTLSPDPLLALRSFIHYSNCSQHRMKMCVFTAAICRVLPKHNGHRSISQVYVPLCVNLRGMIMLAHVARSVDRSVDRSVMWGIERWFGLKGCYVIVGLIVPTGI